MATTKKQKDAAVLVPIKLAKKWKPMSINKTFWKEVLEGRTISKVKFDKTGVKTLVLDDGVHVEVCGHEGRLAVQVEE